jgi:hypothetical protein
MAMGQGWLPQNWLVEHQNWSKNMVFWILGFILDSDENMFKATALHCAYANDGIMDNLELCTLATKNVRNAMQR